jgi:predicted nucleotidyltransferase
VGDRRAEVEDLVSRIAGWARTHPDIRAVALVGSWARGQAGPNSDVDVVVLTDDPPTYLERSEWAAEIGGELIATRPWGAITERRLRFPSGLEVDVGVGRPSWAAIDPADLGTRAVVRGGLKIIDDPEGILAALAAASAQRP